MPMCAASTVTSARPVHEGAWAGSRRTASSKALMAPPKSSTPYAALENVAHGERAGDRGQISPVLSCPERRGPRCHADAGDLHQRVHDLFGHPLAEYSWSFAKLMSENGSTAIATAASGFARESGCAGTSSPALRRPSRKCSRSSPGPNHFPSSSHAAAAKSGFRRAAAAGQRAPLPSRRAPRVRGRDHGAGESPDLLKGSTAIQNLAALIGGTISRASLLPLVEDCSRRLNAMSRAD